MVVINFLFFSLGKYIQFLYIKNKQNIAFFFLLQTEIEFIGKWIHEMFS